MRRYIIALVALLMVMGLSLWGIVSTSPSASASTTRPASVGPYAFYWNPTYSQCQSFGTNCWAIQQNGSVFINGSANAIYIGGNGGGYQEFTVANNGKCLGWNNSLAEIVPQNCTGASYQLWAGTGTAPDLIWNLWEETNYPHLCPIPAGYTQQVISAPSGNADLRLECPLDNGFTVYDSSQKWDLLGTSP